MIEEFNRNAKMIGIDDKMVGYKADLLSDSVPDEFSGPEYTEFDMVAVSMALHHFEYPQMALQRLGSRLKKGGVCMIIDILSRSGHDHGHGGGHDHGHSHGHGHGHGEGQHGHNFGEAAHTVKTHGFSREDMQKLFEGAGLDHGFKYEVIPEQLVFNKGEKTHSVTVFIARAQRS
jgi:SAM-dependent methyltransferase